MAIGEKFSKEFSFRGYLSGDFECFCFAVPEQDCKDNNFKWDEFSLNRFNKGLVSVYPDSLLPNSLDNKGQLFRFKIKVEAEPIDSAELPPLSKKMLRAIKKRQSSLGGYFSEDRE